MINSTLHPWNVEIEDVNYPVEKLNIGDYKIAASITYEQWRLAVNEKYKELEDTPENTKARITEYNDIEMPDPYQVRHYMLSTSDGMALALWLSLRKKTPTFTLEIAYNLVPTDDLIQLLFDILDMKRVISNTDVKKN